MEVIDSKNESFKPTHFITIYSRNHSEYSEKYLEIGEIFHDGNKFAIGASLPATNEFLDDLVNCIKVTNFKALRFKSVIPKNVLYFHSENHKPTIVWTRPEEKRYLHFADHIGIPTGEYTIPNIIFVLRDDELFVYRITSDLDDTTNLYLLPLPNIHEDSRICLGSNASKLKVSKCLEDVIKKYEDLFYKTRFNALHNEQILPDGFIYTETAQNPDITEWPLQPAEIKTFKELLHGITK